MHHHQHRHHPSSPHATRRKHVGWTNVIHCQKQVTRLDRFNAAYTWHEYNTHTHTQLLRLHNDTDFMHNWCKRIMCINVYVTLSLPIMRKKLSVKNYEEHYMQNVNAQTHNRRRLTKANHSLSVVVVTARLNDASISCFYNCFNFKEKNMHCKHTKQLPRMLIFCQQKNSVFDSLASSFRLDAISLICFKNKVKRLQQRRLTKYNNTTMHRACAQNITTSGSNIHHIY